MAIAIATVLVAAGLSVTPPAAALTADCNEDFDIADSESLSQIRSLDPGETKVGHEPVDDTADEELTAKLESSNDELTWQVFYLDSNNNCTDYTAGGCNGENVIDEEDEEQSCTLNPPSSGTRDYFVVYKHTEDNAGPMDDLDFRTWTSTI